MELRILGPVEVRHDGSTVHVRGAKPRQLLALLATRPNRPVTADQLIDELWQENPPPSAATALRVHIRRVREALELERNPNAPSARLPAGPHGYVLKVEPDELDAERFERSVLLAREALSNGEPDRAVPQLTAALDLWRGPALVDIADLVVARGEITRLDELRAVAIEDLLDARLSLGEHALVIDLAGEALREFPLRERLTASLMLALYRTGRQADAVRAYAALARRLDDTLGVSPSQELRVLEEDILLQRSDLAAPPPRPTSAPRERSRASHVRFIGRRTELRQLLDTQEAVSDGPPKLVLVSGPAGVGKTTLTEEFVQRGDSRESVPFIGRCSPDTTGDYHPIVEILRMVVDRAAAAGALVLAPALSLVLPELAIDEADAPHRDDTEGAQFRLFEAIATTLGTHLAAPRTLLIEDLHWADRPTLLLLHHLLRHPSLDGTLIVATYRDDDIDSERAEAIERLARSSRRTRIELSPFDNHEVRAFVRATAAPESLYVLVEVAESLHDITGGNPFFLRELLRELDEELLKRGSADDLAETLATIAPAGVRALVDGRVARLSESAARIMRAAAALGRDLSVESLGAISRLSTEDTREGLEEGLAARLLVEDYQRVDEYLFPHALVRNVVYASIPPAERPAVHRGIAEYLAALAPSEMARRRAEVAHHYVEAAPLGLRSEAAKYSRDAGDDAASRFAFAEAARWYDQAISFIDEQAGDERRAGLYLALGRAYANDKQPAPAQAAFATAADYARRSPDPTLLVDVALAADNPWALPDDFQPHALALLEEALGNVDSGDHERRVRLLDRIAANLYYSDPDREGRIAAEALDLARQADAPVLLAAGERALHLWQTHVPEAHAERLATARRAYELSCAAGGTTGLLLAERGLIVDLLENQQVTEAATQLDDYEHAARALGSPHDIYWSMALRATQATLHGDLDVAEQLAHGAMLRGHEVEQVSAGTYILQRFILRYQQARLAEETPLLQQMGEAKSVYRAGAALHAVALADTGRHDDAIATTRRALGPDASALPRDAFWVAGLSLFASVAAIANDVELCEQLREMLRLCADHLVIFGAGAAVFGAGHQWLGLLNAALGQTDTALDHFEAAKSIATSIEAPYWVAQAAIDSASTLSKRGRTPDHTRVQQLAAEARAIAEPRDFGRILRQARRLA